jgi:hypothetical protein
MVLPVLLPPRLLPARLLPSVSRDGIATGTIVFPLLPAVLLRSSTLKVLLAETTVTLLGDPQKEGTMSKIELYIFIVCLFDGPELN